MHENHEEQGRNFREALAQSTALGEVLVGDGVGPEMTFGDYKIEILGISKTVGTTKGDMNRYQLYWRLRPNAGEQLKMKHLAAHKMSLSDTKNGINKVEALHPDAGFLFDEFIDENKDALVNY